MYINEYYFQFLNRGNEERLAREVEWKRVALERAEDAAEAQSGDTLASVLTRPFRQRWLPSLLRKRASGQAQ